MKKILNIFLFSFILLLIFIFTVLSTIGYETENFNNFITNKIYSTNKNVSLNLKKVKFKLDVKNISLFLETKDPNINYYGLRIPIKDIKVYLNIISLIKSKTKINKVHINSDEIDIEKLKRDFD